jgi:hypothetical protein
MADHHKAQSVKQTNETAHQRRSVESISQEWVGLEPFDLTTLQRSVDNPGLARPDDILKLQRAYGNQAVTCLIQPFAPAPALPSTALGTGGTGRTGKLRVQARLMVGPVGDKYEQEADRVAEQVVGLVASPSYKPIQRREEEEELAQTKLLFVPITPVVRRQEEEEEEEEEGAVQTQMVRRQEEEEEEEEGAVQTQMVRRQEEEEEEEEGAVQTQMVRRQEEEEEEEGAVQTQMVRRQEEEEEEEGAVQTKVETGDSAPAQRQPAGQIRQIPGVGLLRRTAGTVRRWISSTVRRQGSSGEMPLSPQTEKAINRSSGSGHPLSDHIRGPMEGAFEADFSGVRVHTDSQADRLSRSLNALAFTKGPGIYFKAGEYSPGSTSGQKLIAHELTHVVQQGGAVQRQPRVVGKTRPRVQRGLFSWLKKGFGWLKGKLKGLASWAAKGLKKLGGAAISLAKKLGKAAAQFMVKYGGAAIGWLRKWGTRVIGWVRKWGTRVIGWLRKWGTRVIGWLTKLGDKLLQLIAAIGAKVFQFIAKIAPVGWDIVKGIFKFGIGMLKLVFAIFKLLIQLIPILAKIFIQLLEKLGKKFITLLKTAGKKILEFLKKYPWVVPLIVVAIPLLPVIWPYLLIGGAVYGIVALMMKYGPKVWEWLQEYGPQIIDWIIKAGPKLFTEWIPQVGKKIFDWIKEYGLKIFEWIKQAGPRVWEWLKEYGPKIFEWIKQAGPRVWEWLKEYGPKIWGWLKEYGSKIWEWMKEIDITIIFKWLSEAPENAARLLEEYSDTIIKWVKKYGPQILEFLLILKYHTIVLIIKAMEYIPKILGWIMENPDKVLPLIIEYGQKIINWLIEVGYGLIEAIVEFGTGLLKTFAQIADKAIQWIKNRGPGVVKDLFEWIAKFGKEIVEGIINFGPAILDMIKDLGISVLQLWETAKALILFIKDTLAQGWDTVIAILKDPIKFLQNVSKAIAQGVEQFFGNFVKNVLNAFLEWLFDGVGVNWPLENYTPMGFLNMGLEILGLNYGNVFNKALGKYFAAGQGKFLSERLHVPQDALVDLSRSSYNIDALFDSFVGLPATVDNPELRDLCEILMMWKDRGPAYGLQLLLGGNVKGLDGETHSLTTNFLQDTILPELKEEITEQFLGTIIPVLGNIKSTIEAWRMILSTAQKILVTLRSFVDLFAEIAKGVLKNAANAVEEFLWKKVLADVVFKGLATYFGIQAAVEQMNQALRPIRDKASQFIAQALGKLKFELVKGE